MKVEKNAKSKTVLILLGMLISSSLLFNLRSNFVIKSEKLDNITKLPLHPSDPNQYQLEWYKLWDESGSQVSFGVAIDSYGYLYQAASTTGGPFGGYDGLLVKYDSSGTQIWNRTWGKLVDDSSRGVAVDSNDFIYVVGTIDYDTDDHEEKFILLKFDTSGTQLWNRTWSDVIYAEGRSIVVDSTDSIYITGHAGNLATSDIAIVKYNSVGAKLWQRIWGGSNYEGRYGLDLAVDSQDNLYVGAQTGSFGAGSSDAVIIKYNSSGFQLWNQTWGGVEIDGAEAIALDTENNIYIGGYTDSFGTGTRNMFLAKFDNSGVHLWNKTWAGINNANCKDLTLDPLGNIYITGDTSFGGFEYYVTFLKYDKYGSLLLNKTWGSGELSGGKGIVIDSLYNAYITGVSQWYDGILSAAVLLKYSEIHPEPLILLDIVHHSYSSDEFNFTFFIYNETGNGIDFATIQMWWDGTDVSGSVVNLGGGLYIVTLDPITVSPTEDPILLNATISASGYSDKYYEAYFALERVQTIRLIYLDIVHHSYSSDEFNFTFFIYNETGNDIDFATIQMWWDGTDVSGSVVNLGGGLYIVTLDPITVSPTEDPILLNMTISASGYDDKYHEAYFAVDPEVIDKTIPDEPNGFPGYILFYIFGIFSILVVAILIRKKIKN